MARTSSALLTTGIVFLSFGFYELTHTFILLAKRFQQTPEFGLVIAGCLGLLIAITSDFTLFDFVVSPYVSDRGRPTAFLAIFDWALCFQTTTFLTELILLTSVLWFLHSRKTDLVFYVTAGLAFFGWILKTAAQGIAMNITAKRSNAAVDPDILKTRSILSAVGNLFLFLFWTLTSYILLSPMFKMDINWLKMAVDKQQALRWISISVLSFIIMIFAFLEIEARPDHFVTGVFPELNLWLYALGLTALVGIMDQPRMVDREDVPSIVIGSQISHLAQTLRLPNEPVPPPKD
ncbi:hypothetical protein EDD86DRAFT_200431 [Gorgonomyces haynaldii]|nr:hypothetical protein EDD86DRAFT_200431 [Gorgonomyces haynaldii]